MVDRSGALKLLDFGVVKAALARGVARSESGQIKGKIGYLAPEIIARGSYDQRVDLFAVGVVLWELLAQRRLFDAADDSRRLWLNLQCEVEPPSAWNPAVGPALDALVHKALARDPAHRHADAAALARDLAPLIAAHPWSAAETVALLRQHAPAVEPQCVARSERTGGAGRVAGRERTGGARRGRWALASGLALALAAVGLAWPKPRPISATMSAPQRADANPVPTRADERPPSPPPLRVALDGSVVLAGGSAWQRPAGLAAITSAELTLVYSRVAPATVAAAAPAASSARAKPRRRSAPRAGASQPGDELDKVIGQTGLIDVYSAHPHTKR
jgi:hypothetical protein